MGLFSRKSPPWHGRPTTLPEEDEAGPGSAVSSPQSLPENEIRAESIVKDPPPIAPAELMGRGWRPDAADIRSAPAHYPLSEAEGTQAETAVRRRGGNIEIRGRVHGITEMPDEVGSICQFRVDAYDKDGQRISFPVELRGRRFIGLLNEGDLVHFTAKAGPGETLRIKMLRNLTTSGAFQARGASLRERVKLAADIPGIIIYVVLQAAFFVGFMWVLISLFNYIFGS